MPPRKKKEPRAEANEVVDLTGDVEPDLASSSSQPAPSTATTGGGAGQTNGPNPSYIVELAKSGRAECRKCDEKIPSKSIRVGVSLEGQWGLFTRWQHLACTIFHPSLSSCHGIEGFNELSAEEQEQVRARFEASQHEEDDDMKPLDPDALVRKCWDSAIEPCADLLMPLLPYQKEGLGWMLHQEQSSTHGGILADEMGMGKTIQAVSIILQNRPNLNDKAQLKEWRESDFAHGWTKEKEEMPRSGTLIVLPTVAIRQWQMEIARFTKEGSLKVKIYHGSDRNTNIEDIAAYDVIITSYKVLEIEYRKATAGTKVECRICGKKFYPEKLRVHRKYFCGEGAHRTEAQSKTQKKRGRPSKSSSSTAVVEEDEDEDEEEEGYFVEEKEEEISEPEQPAAHRSLKKSSSSSSAKKTPKSISKAKKISAGSDEDEDENQKKIGQSKVTGRKRAKKQEVESDIEDSDTDEEQQKQTSSRRNVKVKKNVPKQVEDDIDDSDTDEDARKPAAPSRGSKGKKISPKDTEEKTSKRTPRRNAASQASKRISKNIATESELGGAQTDSSVHSDYEDIEESISDDSSSEGSSDNEEEDEDEDVQPRKRSRVGKTRSSVAKPRSKSNNSSSSSKKKTAIESEEDEELVVKAKAPVRGKKRESGAMKKKFPGEQSSDDEDSVPAKKRAGRKKMAQDQDDDYDEEVERDIREAVKLHAKLIKNNAPKSVLHEISWFRVILDEAHLIKDRSTSTAKAVFNLISLNKWCLTGTPLQNRVGELYSLIRFLRFDPHAYYFCRSKGCGCKSLHYRFTNSKCDDCGHSVIQHFCHFNKHILNPIQRSGFVAEGRKAMLVLKQQVLDEILLRRTKTNRADDIQLPMRIVRVRQEALDDKEEDFYKALYTQSQAQFNTYLSEGTVLNNYAHIFDILIRLRQAVDHPYLVIHSQSQSQASQQISFARDLNNSTISDTVTEKKETDPDDCICELCKEPPEDRVTAGCGHHFCRSCVFDYMDTVTSADMPSGSSSSQKRNGAARGLVCPECAKPLTLQLESSLSQQPDILPSQSVWDPAKRRRKSILDKINLSQFQSSTKMEALMEELHRMEKKDPGAKAIVFSQFVNMLDLLEFRIQMGGIKCVKLSGSMNVEQRDKIITTFKQDCDVKVMLISLKAGGFALNLTVANYIYLMDPWWNPAAEMQAIDRTHRIGQYKPIYATRFIIDNTIEERILQLQEKKKLVFDGTVGGDAASMTKLTVDDMRFLFH